MGGRMGAHVFQSVPSTVSCVIDMAGPTNFLLMDQQSGEGTLRHNGANSPEGMFMGFALNEHPKAVLEASPLEYVHEDAPPFFIVHGTLDPLVPVNQSRMLVDKLDAFGVPYTFVELPGAGHLTAEFGGKEVENDLLRFLNSECPRRGGSGAKSAATTASLNFVGIAVLASVLVSCSLALL